MIEQMPDDRVSIAEKLNHTMNEQALFGSKWKIKDSEEVKTKEDKKTRLLAVVAGVAAFFIFFCLGVILMGSIY